ncbi:MAG: gliding motility-associated C-terminal domain-containing protein [Flavobacteriales bacterium]|nr:gliding motility-associated C-terminal domain-containing protein [Flavobacteriales bacterium]
MKIKLKSVVFLSLLAFCTVQLVSAQIVNPGFEVASAYPSNTGQWQILQSWTNAGSLLASPDYYHYLGSSQADLPETPMAMVEPAEGEALVGLIVCGPNHTNIREYISTQFNNPLEVGKDYIVSYKLCNGYKTEVSTAGLAVSDIGLYFSTNPVLQVGQNPIAANPQFTIDTVFYSRDWVCVNFTLHSDQAYRYMTFGLFGPDDNKDIEVMEGANPLYGYYFVDDFFIQEVPEDFDPSEEATGKGDQTPPSANENPNSGGSAEIDEFFIPNTFTPNGDGNNDYFLPVSTQVHEYDLEIFNRWGERLFKATNPTIGWDGWYNSQRAEGGAYVWEISFMSTDENGEPKVKSLSGIVNLVR